VIRTSGGVDGGVAQQSLQFDVQSGEVEQISAWVEDHDEVYAAGIAFPIASRREVQVRARPYAPVAGTGDPITVACSAP
jgi:hypothetical protein